MPPPYGFFSYGVRAEKTTNYIATHRGDAVGDRCWDAIALVPLDPQLFFFSTLKIK
jgi:hypothetical protein